MPPDVLARRLPLYAYLEPLFAGRKVLEIGRAREGSAEYLLAHGAARVVNADGDVSNVTDRFDVVVVPEADALLGLPGAVASWKALLAGGGRLIAMVANPDRSGGGGGGGAGYYELSDALGSAFATVQMLAVTPFLGVGLVEFGGAADGLRIDSRFVKAEAEAPVSYVAVAGSEPLPGLGYALVQLPWISGPLREVESSVELRRKLQEAAAQADSAMRVARAQSDEIEELRGRLRRGTEDRSALDAEVAKLRQALAEADDSVVSLTRRTAEQMSMVAEKLASGLRIPAPVGGDPGDLAAARAEVDRLRARLHEAEARATAAEQRLEEIGSTARERAMALEDALERLRLSEAELGRARRAAARAEEGARAATADARSLGERDQAVLARDERIARLETEKQDLIWRLSELEDRLREAIARAVREAPRGAAGEARAEGEITAVRVAREKALEGFHAAATAHVGELTELKASVSEQAALVAELEDAVTAAEARAVAAESELSGLRKTAKDLGEADRTRRSRLAELEGKLLRLEHERKAASAQPGGGGGEELDRVRRALDSERADWTRERAVLGARIDELLRAATGKNGHDTGTAAIARELEAIETELRSEVARIDAAAGPADDETTSRLRDTLGNYRQRAERLRDDLVGVRRRLGELSPTEIASFLEELGEDLAELGK
jgi:chromosome segregation ATPase